MLWLHHVVTFAGLLGHCLQTFDFWSLVVLALLTLSAGLLPLVCLLMLFLCFSSCVALGLLVHLQFGCLPAPLVVCPCFLLPPLAAFLFWRHFMVLQVFDCFCCCHVFDCLSFLPVGSRSLWPFPHLWLFVATLLGWLHF